jgi:hypothetical protein
MGELKPLGSEKLSGDAKIKRILELTYYQSSDSKPKSAEIVKESKTGVYGIVKEKDGYYVKQGLNENSLDYIGGLFMKNKNRFSSYSEAFKKLEFLTEQELLAEATKYVLKQNKPAPQAEAPAPMPTTDTAPVPPPPPAPDAGVPTDTAPEGDTEGEPEDPNDFMKVVQKMTGRLTQKLNTYQDKLESKDIKYVLNMVLAAVDLDKLDEADEDEILAKFEDDEEGAEPTSDFPTDGNGEVPAPQDEMSEVDGMAALDELINTPLDEFDDEDNFEELTPEDTDFLNDPEIKRAGRSARKDIEKEIDPHDEEDTAGEDLDNPLNAKDEFPLYQGEDREVEEDSMMGQMPNMAASDVAEQNPSEEDRVKELDINELTDMVNTSVKETLSKYFN